MSHKEWEPDDFLNEFLDFDYRKPVDNHENTSQDRPAEKQSQISSTKKNYGLRDDYNKYENLRHSNERSAGERTAVQADAERLRSSGALHKDNQLSGKDIPEPLSARKDIPEYSSAKLDIPEPLSSRNAMNGFHQNSAGSQGRASQAGTVKKEPAAPPAKSAKPSESKPKKHLFGGGRAAEIASGAFGAAKKFVSSDENQAPEEIPSAANNASDISGIGTVHDPYVVAEYARKSQEKQAAAAEQRDELAEMFPELGETAGATVMSSEENEALAQAQHDAYDRYRGNYLKGMKKRSNTGKAGRFQVWLSRIYLLALAAFVVLMTVMNVLPFGMLIAFYVILGLLSVILIMQLRRERTGKGARVISSGLAILLICLFGLGSAYAMGTLSFLDTTSVENDSRVASITRDPFNVCISGIDVDGKIDEQGRSDVNMIVTVNPKTEQILMTSIPRDYQIYMPDKDNAMDKLTHTGFYSVQTTIGAEEQLLDTKINYYVKVNFTTVKKFIDAVGGIDVYSEYEFTPVKMKSWTVQKGWNHMNGKQALAFARERKAFVDGDNQRIKNQQAVFEALLKKAMSSKTVVLSYNKILSNLEPYFRMSFSSGELRSLIKLQLAKDPKWKMFKNTIIGGDGSLPTYTTGGAYAYVMTQDETSINNAKTLINAILEGKLLDKDDDNNVFVVDENGEGEDSGESGDPEGE